MEELKNVQRDMADLAESAIFVLPLNSYWIEIPIDQTDMR